jgi:predicted TIM-barrel fold metal-dependent hydrolase
MSTTVDHRDTGTATDTAKIWANSGDSHFLEPDDLWTANLTPEYAELVPRSEKDPDGEWETVHVDGQSFRRKLPSPAALGFYEASHRPAGARDARLRMVDLDNEGIWGEVVFPSLGMWSSSFRTPAVLREALKVSNDWALEAIAAVSPRLVVAAQVSTLSIPDAIEELQRCAGLGFKTVFMPTTPHPQQDDYNRDSWEPFWAAAEEANMVLSFHIGTDPIDIGAGQKIGVAYRGPGGAVLNHTASGYSGQHATMKLVASGALDRHPNLRVLIAEGGASWVPFLGDRMTEAYRQHHMAVRPKLSRSPKEILYSQVYASFQHDESAVATLRYLGYNNVMWGSDYPHLEGTFGHTQETLHHLFDDQPAAVQQRITIGAFAELFPSVDAPPID